MAQALKTGRWRSIVGLTVKQIAFKQQVFQGQNMLLTPSFVCLCQTLIRILGYNKIAFILVESYR